MPIDNVLNEDRYCNCTERRNSKCGTCGKDIPFVDSPYGAIPTMELVDRFYEDIETAIEEKHIELEAALSNMFNPLMKSAEEKFKKMDNATEDITIRLRGVLDSEMKARFDKTLSIFKEYENDIKKHHTAVQASQGYFCSIVRKAYDDIFLTLDGISKIMTANVDAMIQFKLAKAAYVDYLLPMLEKLSVLMNALNKVMPFNHEIKDLIDEGKILARFQNTRRTITSREMATKRKQFDEDWEKLTIVEARKLE